MKMLISESQMFRLYDLMLEQEGEVEFQGSVVERILNQLKTLEKEYSDTNQELQNKITELQPLYSELNQKKENLESFKRTFIPSISIAEAFDKTAGKKYVRASIRYYVEGSDRQKTTSIHLGKLSDFPLGLHDPRLKELALRKAIEFVSRRAG